VTLSSPTLGPETFPRPRRRLDKVMRPSRRLSHCLLKVYGPPGVSVIAFCRSSDLSMAVSLPCYRCIDLPVAPSSPAIGLRTSRRLRRRPLKVYGPPDVSVVAFCRSSDLSAALSSPCCRSIDLPVASSSPSLGLQTSRHLHRRPLKVYGLPNVSVIALCRSTDLLASPLSSSVGL
jgi:hypothetical protein